MKPDRRVSSVFLLHGLEGSPEGAKATWLRRHFHVVAPALNTTSMDAAHSDALRALHDGGDDAHVLIGSSFGGALAMRLVAEGRWVKPVVLLAPAIGLAPESMATTARVAVVHGRRDELIPWRDVVERFADHGDGLQLFLGGWEHRLRGALEDGSVRRAIHWALGLDVRSRGEAAHARRARIAELDAPTDPGAVEALRNALVEWVDGASEGDPTLRWARALLDGSGFDRNRPLEGATVEEVHALIAAVGWRFRCNRASGVDGRLVDRILIGDEGPSRRSLTLHAVFPWPSGVEDEPSD